MGSVLFQQSRSWESLLTIQPCSRSHPTFSVSGLSKARQLNNSKTEPLYPSLTVTSWNMA